VNSVTFFPDGFGLGTGADDRTCKFFDTRCMVALASFGNEKIAAGISSVAFSKSGRLLFGGYEDHSARGWDILADPAGASSCAAHLVGHENRVSSLAINPQGDALLTGSWDTVLRVSSPPPS
jgi:guanine nucleotide-binding protein G(I)/G(S)/G(T) subunit beta-1